MNPTIRTRTDHPQTGEPAVACSALFGFFKVRPARNGLKGFIAWGALERLTAEDAVTEPAEPMHFQFAANQDEAVEKLTTEMDAAYGKRRWWRQDCNPNDQAEPRGPDRDSKNNPGQKEPKT